LQDLSVEPPRARSSQVRNGSTTAPPIPEMLSAEDSTAIKTQLIREIETLSGDELQSRAIVILNAKNRLSADDAKQVEHAFVAEWPCRTHRRRRFGIKLHLVPLK